MKSNGALHMADVNEEPHSKPNVARVSQGRREVLLGVLLGLGLLGSTGHACAAQQATPPAQTILVVGDSLSAEYGLARGAGWVALLTDKLKDRPNIKMINASISGDTTAGGVTRLPPLLKAHNPTHVVIELGANDALRGLPLKGTLDNLARMTRQCKQAGAKVVLVGMMLPPNFGQRYALSFAAIYPKVAQAEGARAVPFFLKGVADRPDSRDWFQADGIHPLAKGHPVMLENVWRELSPLL
jgi:acyl-CoA thioesterase-1